MSDNVDIANDLMMASTSEAIRAVTERRATVGSINCVECGDEIPEKRREAIPYVSTCVECQSYLDREAVRYG